MVSEQPVPEVSGVFENLTLSNVPDMLELIELTHPGPFLPRTIKIGNYIGIRQNGQLIAMAGERMSVPGYREISAVCTHPDHQGKGYARLLVSNLVNQHCKAGIASFLHVFENNTLAIHLYEKLHFQKRCEMQGLAISR
jgi:predicted GNAT family acetyltransferase